MLKRSITYKDFNGNEVSDIHYFNLTRTELIEMEFNESGTLSELLQRIVDTNNHASLISEFKRLILLAYGVKSDDGKRFIKTQELRDEFVQSAAYDELFMELATNDKSASDFVNGIMPMEMVKEIQKELKAAELAAQASAQLPPPPPQI